MDGVQAQRFTRGEWKILLSLAAVQFVNLLDFVIMMPLAPRLMLSYKIDPEQFSHLVSAYGIAACLSAIVASFFVDRFDRRTVLMVLLVGFTIGTAGCAIASNYWEMLASRVVAGVFGGVMGSISLAIVGDRFVAHRRGSAMGVVMSSFALVSVMGIPFGLTIADAWGTSAPFELIAGSASVLIVILLFSLPRCVDHLNHARIQPLKQFTNIITNPRYLLAYLFGAIVVSSGFLVIPFLAAFMVYNVGIRDTQVKYVYLVCGACTLLSMNLIGRWSDRWGKKSVFRIIAICAAASSLAMTHLPATTLLAVMLVCACFMVFTSGRVVPAQAIVTGVAPPHERAGFMSLNSAVQHLSLGVATLVTGQLVTEGPAKELIGYDKAGVISVILGLISIVLIGFLKSAESKAPVRTSPDIPEERVTLLVSSR